MRRVALFLAISCLFSTAVQATTLSEYLAEYGISFDSVIRTQSYYSQTDLSDTVFNPGNQLAQLNDAEFFFEFRPDFSLSYQAIDLMVKPRFQYIWEHVDTTSEDYDQKDSSAFINEWRIRAGLTNRAFISYGREVLLWGPSMLFSPSNPFFIDNGRSDPFRELGGRDYLQAIYLPNQNLTFSLISNVAQGRGENFDLAEFERTDAIKMDYIGQKGYSSLILSHQQDGPYQIGGYFQLTLSDALLLYGEGGYTQGTQALYPYQTVSPPGWDFVASKRDGHGTFGNSLLGLAYTFAAGPTVNVEYIYNSAGYSDQEARDYFNMAEQLGSDFASGDLSVASLLAQAADPRLPLLRRHYMFVQFLNTNIRNKLDVTLRYTRSLDDNSGNFIAIFDLAANDNTHLFALGLVNHGDARSEFGRYIGNQWLIGINLTF